MMNSIDKLFQSFHSATFSPCGGYLAFSDRNGSIYVHRLSNLMRQIDPNADLSSENVVKLRPHAIINDTSSQSSAQLLGWRDYLLCCFPNGQINAYLWSDISKQRTTTAWTKRFCDPKNQMHDEFETWTTFVDNSGRELLLAGGSGSEQSGCPILCWEFENAKLLASYQGHTNSVYCIKANSKPDTATTEFLSAGEGGEVRLWDLRSSSNSVAVVKPFESDCARPNFGRWIGCLVGDGDWMVCGGGPQLGLWHIGSRSLVKPMTAQGSGPVEHYCGTIVDEKIITGGSGSRLYHWDYRGDSVAVMPTVSDFVYDLKCNSTNTRKMLAAVGSGNLIDFYSNLIYRMTPVETIF